MNLKKELTPRYTAFRNLGIPRVPKLIHLRVQSPFLSVKNQFFTPLWSRTIKKGAYPSTSEDKNAHLV